MNHQNLTAQKRATSPTRQGILYTLLGIAFSLGLNVFSLGAKPVLTPLVQSTFQPESRSEEGEKPAVTLAVNEDVEIVFKMLGTQDGTEIRIDPGNGNLSTHIINKEGTSWNNFIKPIRVRAMGTQLKIYGTIRHLDCSTNQQGITAMELGENPRLEVLKVENNTFTSLDLSHLRSLQEFSCKGSKIATLQLPNPSALVKLRCSGVPLSELDLRHQVNLEQLIIDGCRQLQNLDFSTLTKLTSLSFKNTQTPEIDLTACKALETAFLAYGQLATLKLSPSQTALREIHLEQNAFTACSLDETYNALPKVSKKASIFVAGNPGATTAHSELATAKGWAIDTQGDGSGCATSTANRPKEGTPFVALAVEPQTLIQLSLKVKEDTDIFIEAKPGVFVKESIKAVTNPQGALAYGSTKKYRAEADTLKVYGDILGFDCSQNKEKLKGIDIRQMPNLEDLMCQENQIETLDLAKAINLAWLFCGNNRLTTLDLSPLSKLEVADCSENLLTSLTPSQSVALRFLSIAKNQLDACAINEIFFALPQQENQKGVIRIGENPGASTSNPVIFSTKGWKSDLLGDGTGCPNQGPSQAILRTQFKVGEKLKLTIETSDNKLEIEGLAGVWENGKQVEYIVESPTIVLKGNISKINCQSCKLSSLDFINCPELTSLRCSWNDLKKLNVAFLPQLEELRCSWNKLAALDLSANKALKILYCSKNQIEGLKLDDNLLLEQLYAGYNPLGTIDLSKNTKLNYLSLIAVGLETIDLSQLAELIYLELSENKLSTIDLSKNNKLHTLALKENNLTQVELTACEDIALLDLSKNKLTALDLSKQSKLTQLYCYDNKLTTLDLSTQKALEELSCGNNQLGHLNTLADLPSLLALSCYGNKIQSIDLSHNEKLQSVVIGNNQLKELSLKANKQIEFVECFGNKIEGEAMIGLMTSLPQQDPSVEASIYIIDSQDDKEGNICLKSDVAIAQAKAWEVYDYNGDYADSLPYSGSETATENPLSEEAPTISQTADGFVVVETTPHTAISLYDIDGRCLLREVTNARGVARLDLSHFPSQVYLINIEGVCYKVIR